MRQFTDVREDRSLHHVSKKIAAIYFVVLVSILASICAALIAIAV